MAQTADPQPKSRGALLPFAGGFVHWFSYGILTLLVVEQGRTIEASAACSGRCAKDSSQLATLKTSLRHEVPGAVPRRQSDGPNEQKEAASSPLVRPCAQGAKQRCEASGEIGAH